MRRVRLSDAVTARNVEAVAGSLRKYGYRGPARPGAVAGWLRAQGRDIDTLVAAARRAERQGRPGQAAFRRALLEAYGRRCAITGCDVEPALEASHLADWRSENDAGAGILLRADLHRLLEDGHLVIGPDYRVAEAPPWYAELRGRRLRLPPNRLHWPRLPRDGPDQTRS